MANYFDDIETSLAAVVTAYNALCVELVESPAVLEQLRYAIFTDLMPVASGVALKDMCAELREFGGTSVGAVQATAGEGAGDYTP